VVGVIWAIMWFFLVYNTPATHPRISAEERDYIETALNVKGGGKVCEKKRLYNSMCHRSNETNGQTPGIEFGAF